MVVRVYSLVTSVNCHLLWIYPLILQCLVVNCLIKVVPHIILLIGQSADQVLFRDILLHLRDATTTIADWEELMKQTPSKVDDMSLFLSAVHLFPTVESVVEYNITQLRAITVGRPFFEGYKFRGFRGFLGLPRNLFHRKLTEIPS